MSIGLMNATAPFIRFVAEEVEDRNESIEKGYYVSKTIHMANVIPAGGRDGISKPIEELIALWKQKGQHGHQPMEWHDQLVRSYNAWKEGNELPEIGTPVMTFLPFSPAQRSALLAANIRTIEQCAEMNEDTMSRVGMGARELKDRAKQALSTADKTAAENLILKAKVEEQESALKSLQEQINALSKKAK
jgi:hypothetical protein